MARSRFQLRVVGRRSLEAPGDRGLVADRRPNGRNDLLVWRLLGTNNRELGRSGEQYDSVEACIGSIERLRSALGGSPPIRPTLSSVQDLGSVWAWSVLDSGEVLASAVRAFSRQIECRKNFESFANCALTATVLPDPASGGHVPRSITVDRQTVRKGVS